jgi:hypothetical protein
MVSWPELVCAAAPEASRNTRLLIPSRARIPPKLKLQFIISRSKN